MNVRSIAAGALALTVLAMSGKVAVAQGRGQDRWQDRGQQQQFTDNDRQVTRDWYQQHQRNLGRGWRQEDRLSPAMEARLRSGQRLDPRLRRQMYWLPADLSRRYGPAPRGYRYAIIGGNIVMLDPGYNVRDVFRIDFRSGGPGSHGQDGWQNGGGWGGRPHESFNDQDRQATREWYQQHQRDLRPGWREQDRLSPDQQGRLRSGEILDPQLRGQMSWLPPELAARYRPAPPGYRYAVIGGNVVLLDDGYRVHDVFSITLHF